MPKLWTILFITTTTTSSITTIKVLVILELEWTLLFHSSVRPSCISPLFPSAQHSSKCLACDYEYTDCIEHHKILHGSVCIFDTWKRLRKIHGTRIYASYIAISRNALRVLEKGERERESFAISFFPPQKQNKKPICSNQRFCPSTFFRVICVIGKTLVHTWRRSNPKKTHCRGGRAGKKRLQKGIVSFYSSF